MEYVFHQHAGGLLCVVDVHVVGFGLGAAGFGSCFVYLGAECGYFEKGGGECAGEEEVDWVYWGHGGIGCWGLIIGCWVACGKPRATGLGWPGAWGVGCWGGWGVSTEVDVVFVD